MFVGRRSELAVAAAAVSAALTGKSRILCFEGEPGIGKTCLAARVATAAHERGAAVLYGRCDERSTMPYQPLVEALEHFVAHTPGAEDSDALSFIARILPGLGPESASAASTTVITESGAERYQLGVEAASLFRAVAVERPLLAVFDDLHWAGEQTVQTLRQVIDLTAGAPLVYMLTWRDTDLGEGHPLHALLADLARRPDAERRSLRGLERDHVGEWTSHVLPERDADAARCVALTVIDRSAGNPLFVRELLRDIAERSDAGGDADSTAGTLPGSIRAVVRDRVARLGDDARIVLEAAAGVGGAFDTALVGACVDLPVDRVNTALDAAVAAGLLACAGGRTGELVFVHVLVEETLYDMQAPGCRGAVHRRVAEELERRAAEGGVVDPAQLARHWSLALPADDVAAVRWMLRAGRRAQEAFAPAAAVRWHAEALATLGRHEGTDAERCEALLGLGQAQRDLGAGAYRQTLLDAARLALRLGCGELAARAAIANHRGFASRTGEIDEERLAVLEEALRLTAATDHRVRALLLATQVAELSFGGAWEKRVEVASAALHEARSSGDPATLSRTLCARFVPLWVPATLEVRLADAEEAVRQADLTGSPALQFEAVHWRAAGLIEAARIDEAEVAARRQDALAERLGQPLALWLSTYDRANLALIGGRLEHAEQLAEDALAIALESGQPDALPFYASQLANIRYDQGRLDELQELVAQVVASNPGIPAFRAVLALACVEADLHHEAATLLDDEASDDFGRLPEDVTRMPALAIWAEVCARVGDAGTSEQLLDLLAPWHEHIAFTGVGSWSVVAHVLGRLAARLERQDEALGHLEEAVACYQRIRAPVWVARAQVDIVEVLLARSAPDDRERSGALLREAMTAASRLDAAGVERRATALARRLRSLDVLGGSRHVASGAHGHCASARPLTTAPRSAVPEFAGELIFEDEVWLIHRGDVSFRIADGRGVRHLARLLAEPGVEFPALDLAAGGGERVAPVSPVAEGLSVRTGGGDAGALLDDQAKRQYRARLSELREELDEAKRFNDPERAARARGELDFLASELSSAVGFGGRDRVAASNAERARVNVTRAIRKAITRLAEHDALLGRELGAAVRTGAFCSFDPPNGVGWRVEVPR